MEHDKMTLHEELLHIIEEQVDSASFAAAVDKLTGQYGEETYAELIMILANIRAQPSEAMALWNAAWQHMESLSAHLDRPVNISVALLDYILRGEEGYIHRAKVIDVRDYERVAQSAIRDGLTGLFNPGYIREQVAWELSKDQRYRRGGTIILFDLNKFKECNDEYGHLAGDAVLRAFATCLMEYTRRSDAVGRYGGDEFLVLMPATPMEGAFIVADRIRQAFEGTAVHVPSAPAEGILVTTTGGIAEYIGGNRTSSEELIETADQALYLGKREGANRIYTEWMIGNDPISIDSDLIKSVTATEHREEFSLDTIGNCHFMIETSMPMAQGQLITCDLAFPGTGESFTCLGRITGTAELQDGRREVVFQAVAREQLDWLPVNQFVLQYKRIYSESAPSS